MKIANIQFPVFNPYNKPALELYFAGCTRNCTRCHNPELLDFNAGELIDIELLQKYLTSRSELFDIISFTGGDFLCQEQSKAFSLLFKIKGWLPNKEYWLFTGEDDFNNIPTWAKTMFNVIKYGSYKEELKQESFPSSSNQIIWNKSLTTERIVI